MLSRALSMATVTLLIGCLTAGAALAENLDAGKSPSQIFSSTCSACHKGPRGLLKNTPASSLPGFLRQHYTTGTDMASVLSAYLISNGAADPRYQSKDQSRKDARRDARQDLRQEAKPEQPERLGRRRPPPQEPSRPDNAESGRPPGEGMRPGRDARRYGRSRTSPDAARPDDGQVPVQAATDSKSGIRQKHGKRGKPVAAEPPKTEQAAPAAKQDDAPRDASRSDAGAMDSEKSVRDKSVPEKSDSAGAGAAKSGPAEPASDTVRSDTSRVDATATAADPPKEASGAEANPLRPDSGPSATSSPPASAAISPSAPVTATAPSAPAGPPAPPISR